MAGTFSQVLQSQIWTSQSLVQSPFSLPIEKTRGGKRHVQTTTCRHISVRELEQPSFLTKGDTQISTMATAPNKGWTDIMGLPDQRLVSQLKALAVLASDRSEMHTILANQRDNWNRLFHSTITIATVSAAAAAALNGAGQQALGLSVVATILGLGVAALMALVNKFQPSQLAEEQRQAARSFKHLREDIEATLEIDPRLRQKASLYLEEKLGTVDALDISFPLPLTPVVLEKFPKVVQPSILSSPVDLSTSEVDTSPNQLLANGWNSAIETDLKQATQLLHTSDIPAYVDMAKSVNNLNKIMAISSPLLAIGGALCNMATAMISGLNITGLAAAMTVGAFFAHSMAHAVQLGAAFETYRNCAGYYADVESSIQKTLRLPVDQREDGMLFLQKTALLLGRSSAKAVPLLNSDDKAAGTLF